MIPIRECDEVVKCLLKALHRLLVYKPLCVIQESSDYLVDGQQTNLGVFDFLQLSH